MRGKPAVLAVVFNCDETLLPDPTSQLLLAYGLDPPSSGPSTCASGSTRVSTQPSPISGSSSSTSAPGGAARPAKLGQLNPQRLAKHGCGTFQSRERDRRIGRVEQPLERGPAGVHATGHL